MATLALAVVGAAAGSALLPAGFTVLGATLSGAAIGAQIGAFAGSYVDQALFGGANPVEGPRLTDMHVTASTEGAPIPRIYGRVRVGSQVIWTSGIKEQVVKSSSGGGGKGGPPGGSGSSIEYRYSASFAVALCEGPATGIARVWADNQEISLANLTYRFYPGSETQDPDSLIAAHLGADSAPAFRGTAYIVFEAMPLAPYGNRIPQLSFEVSRALDPVSQLLQGVVVIPASGEFVYATEPVAHVLGAGLEESLNVHTRRGVADWTASLDQLAEELPSVASVSLTLSWFGTDLRAGACQLHPGVELRNKKTTPISWSVSGRTRANAYLISNDGERPAYGGTPSDQTVIAAIQNLKARGIAVTLTPFILMDVPPGNALPDPYSTATSQPSYPWRGRITCHPAPERPGTVDKTSAAAAQIASLVGTAAPAHFAIAGGAVTYSGPAEWTLRRMVLHMAHLAKAAGGVDVFVLGSELRGLTQVRSGAGTFPFVAALQALAADVKAVLGPSTKVTYAADWSEYFGYQPADGTGDVYFHLDPLWASPAIDAIGVDVYWPLSDWRDGSEHLDYLAGTRSIYDLDYLRGNLKGGEGYHWYYASDANRMAQVRSPITDGAGKPWVFRYKDMASWWMNQHFNRPGGIESAVPTAWVPQSKPFWLMEIGCAAVDKSSNQPNVFVDAKSAESALPYFSSGARDDFMQRRFLQAFLTGFDPASSGYVAGLNPVSAVYGGRMVDVGRVHVYAWDARPYPAFPFDTELWVDGENWRFGHWLNGRQSGVPLDAAVSAILGDYGFADFDSTAINGMVPGFVVDRVMSARDALQPLELAFFFDALESGGKIVLRHRGAEPSRRTFTLDGLVETKPDQPLLSLTRGQETDLPASAKVSFVRADADYRQAVTEARRLAGSSGRVALAELPIVMEPERAGALAESWLYETWSARERAAFTLPPSALALEPGDIVTIEQDGSETLLAIREIGEHGARDIEARSIDPTVFAAVTVAARSSETTQPISIGPPEFEFLDLPVLRGNERPEQGYLAAAKEPWPGAVAAFASADVAGFVLKGLASYPSVMGETLDPFPIGPVGVFDRATSVRVEIGAGELASVTLSSLFAGANTAAIRNAAGDWEVFQYETAELVAPRTYRLHGLLRGQAGTDVAMTATLPPGTRVVFLSEALAPVDVSLSEIRLPLNWRVGPAVFDIGHGSYAARTHTFTGLGLRPYAPVHVRGVRAGGNLALSWIRRTRIGGDAWEQPDVPLSEEQERYEIDILDGAQVKRTLTAATPGVVYTVAQQTADFGAPQASVSVAICQMSATYGRGAAARATL
jgi:hypothetical protein